MILLYHHPFWRDTEEEMSAKKLIAESGMKSEISCCKLRSNMRLNGSILFNSVEDSLGIQTIIDGDKSAHEWNFIMNFGWFVVHKANFVAGQPEQTLCELPCNLWQFVKRYTCPDNYLGLVEMFTKLQSNRVPPKLNRHCWLPKTEFPCCSVESECNIYPQLHTLSFVSCWLLAVRQKGREFLKAVMLF